MPNEAGYAITDLASLAGVTPRTIRYYVSVGLIPAPDQAGRAARYGEDHLRRIRLIRFLQEQHLPLAAIRSRLASLTDDEVASALSEPDPQPAGSALDYIRSLTSGTRQPRVASPPPPYPEDPAAHARPMPSPAYAPPPTTKPVAATWERIPLAPDVELHVRRPLSRTTHKRVERLITIAREILGGPAMTKPTKTSPLQVATDRRLIRSKWHSQRFIVARVDAPVATSDGTRPAVNLAFVLDRSGSMSGRKLQVAARAVEEGIGRLQPTDRFGIVWFDSDVDVLVPGTLATADARRGAIERLRTVAPGGSTNLSGGWLAGCEQVASALIESGVNRVLLLTDGQANVGMTDPAELAHHAAELRLRGVSTTTFGVGDDFQETLLQGMAQAGGGHFHDIADAAAIADHLSSEIGESLEVVARDVELRLTLPDGVRVEGLGAFPAMAADGGTIIALGDLVSGQSVEVPLRLSFPVGAPGETHSAVIALSDRDGVLGGAFDKLAWEHADDAANDIQPRDRAVDRVIATVFAARARQEAVRLNRWATSAAHVRVLEATARRIRSYAGRDAELRRVADELAAETATFERVMPERSRKVAYAESAYALASRFVDGSARRSDR